MPRLRQGTHDLGVVFARLAFTELRSSEDMQPGGQSIVSWTCGQVEALASLRGLIKSC